jgi:hypothetical protein
MVKFVYVGDQGVNGAKWFQGGAILVTASGSGRWVIIITYLYEKENSKLQIFFG